MDYIRQLIMCRADMTIEWAAPYPDALGNENHIDGYGIPHTCTKWVSVQFEPKVEGWREERGPQANTRF